MTLFERIQGILTGAGYRPLPQRFNVAGLPFEFGLALVASEKGHDVAAGYRSGDRDKRKGPRAAYSSVGSRVGFGTLQKAAYSHSGGGRPGRGDGAALSRVCRPVGAPNDQSADQTLRDWLAVLLPLPELEDLSGVADWEAELSKELSSAGDDEHTKKLFRAAALRSAEAVEAGVREQHKSGSRAGSPGEICMTAVNLKSLLIRNFRSLRGRLATARCLCNSYSRPEWNR